jgi:8-oxo-dGTP pyrophosphatase MutT (NUDIX family)
MAQPDAAVAIVHAEDSVLLIRRAERPTDPWSGHWSFPGGRRDPSDPDPLHTALRELEEECGLRLARDQVEAVLPHVHARRRTGPFLVVAPFVFSIPSRLPTILDPREAAESRWIPLETLRDPRLHRIAPVPGAQPEMAYPYIEIPGPPLWGFTYRLITEWLGILPARDSDIPARLLGFLLSQGLTLRHDWEDGEAAVEGEIPVGAVLAELALPGEAIPAVNAVEVRPDRIRVVGLEFEEYRIFCI